GGTSQPSSGAGSNSQRSCASDSVFVIRPLAVSEIGGVLRHPRTPFYASVGTPASLWWQRGATEHRASLPVTFQARPLRCAPPRNSDISLPRRWGGQGIECLSDERFQLILLPA